MSITQVTHDQVQKFIKILARTREPVEKPQSKVKLVGTVVISFLAGMLCQACVEKFVLKGRYIEDLVRQKNILKIKAVSFFQMVRDISLFLYNLDEDFNFAQQSVNNSSHPVSRSSSEEDVNVSPLTSARTTTSVGQRSDRQSVNRRRILNESLFSNDSEDSCWDYVTQGGFRRVTPDGASAASSVNSRVGNSARKR